MQPFGTERLQKPQAFFNASARTKSFFFLAAFLSLCMSIYLFFTGEMERGIFVGIWVPSILSAGTLLLGDRTHG